MKEKPIKDSVEVLSEAVKKSPKLFGIPTGVPGLDDLFFHAVIEDGKPVKKPLGGIPSLSVVNLTGVSDTGKSLMAEQFAVTQASLGYPVLFVTVESPSAFVAQSLRTRAEAIGIQWKDIENNVVLIDAASNDELRENIPSLLSTMAYAIKEYDTKSVVIDSITGLYEAKEMMARGIVRKLFNFMKKWYQTAIFVSQKRSGHEELTAEAAGGYAVGHIVDCSIVLAKKLIMSRFEENTYGAPIGDVVRLIRIDGCRLCGHDTRTHLMRITETGLVEIGPTLDEIRNQGVRA